MTFKTFLTLCRFSNLPTVWMNVVTAAMLVAQAGAPVAPHVTALLALAISLLYCGGMSLNDFFDRHWDATHQPYRPIPAGKVSASAVGYLSLIFLIAGMLLLLAGPSKLGFVAGIGLLFTIIAYDYFHKAHAATVLLMGMARFWVFIVVGMALGSVWNPLILLVGALQFVYTLLVTVVARHEHKRGKAYSAPVIPTMIAAMALVDGALLAVVVAPYWLLVGIVAALTTRWAQTYVRGD